MSDNPIEVYRTTDPEILAAWDEMKARISQWWDDVQAFCVKHSGSTMMWGGNRLGVEIFNGPLVPEDGVIPEGWRRDRKTPGMMVPAKRSPAGKLIAAEMSKLSKSPDAAEALLGMPRTVSSEYRDGSGRGRIHSCGTERREHDLEVTWGCAVPSDQVDERWTRVPLSQWHAEQEAKS
ncbi:hypothetical protein GS532_07655 [Rhodococcus hoagii]|nr:hypothetical protein [Prescottella equi]